MNNSIQEVAVGQKLPSIVKSISQSQIDTYGDAQGDYNPIHHDREWAAQHSLFGGTIAHGMMSMAFISQMVTSFFGISWVNNSEIEVKFLHPVKPGDVISTNGAVADIIPSEHGKLVIYDLKSHNQDGTLVLSGQAKINI